MSKDFLGDLGDAISSQFNVGENTTTSLDAVIDGQNVKYGSLGDFASKFDQSAERKYIEEGYLRRDPYNTDPKQFDILWQEPDATVLVKKRMFSSIAENYRPDFMDADERLYYKAIRVLLQNKCKQISALEKLSKIQRVTAAVGNIDEQLLPVIITLSDMATGGGENSGNLFGLFPKGNPFTTQDASSFVKVVDRLRALKAYNHTNKYTTWITDPTNLFQSTFGAGNGVIELTNFTRISTTTTTDIKNPGRFSISITDPYESMLITDYDIEVALSDATNLFYNNKVFQFGAQSSTQVLQDQQNMLNKIRSARNASPITFKVEPDGILGKRVRAIIDRLGVEIEFKYNALGALSLGGNGGVKVTADYLRGGDIAGYDGLDEGPGYTGYPWKNNARSKSHGNSELQAFQTIIGTIYQQITLLTNAAGNFTADNKSYNYARRKLRFNFSGKLIVQPMDVAHIYMKSKSQFDNKVLSGLTQMFSGFGILQNINNTLTGFKNEFDTLFNPSKNVSVQAEKNMFVGPDFPNYLWATVRGQFTGENEGTHVFAGVVDSALDNWSGGKFTVDISGSDNSIYFRQGKVNFKPGANAFNGLIFDPLTPFKSNFDSVTTTGGVAGNTPELLDENVYLLSHTGQDSLLKYKQGPLAGQKATQGNYIQDQSIDRATGRLTRVFYAPDGLAYKWKQGIGVFVQKGSINTINDPNLVGITNPYQQPFAGLDVMNVLSLLITGIPYNYSTYFKATQSLYGMTGDPQTKQDPSYSFISSLRTSLSKTNALWGNFIPFKNLIMSEAAVAQSMQAQATITQVNSDLDAKLKKLADYRRALTGITAVEALALPGQLGQTTAAKKNELEAQVKNITDSITSSISQFQTATKQFFSNVNTQSAYANNYLIDGKDNPSDSKDRKELRRQTNYLTRRMSYDVRGNMDKSLFIVDDYYDVDYDIAAFNTSLAKGNVETYATEYSDVSSQISHVADLLNLEVFCDSQGHIRVRPPQYNRMPSSVFNRMIYLKHALGVQIFPEFLNNLFVDQLNTLRDRIEIIEDQIRLDCAILGNYNSLDLAGDQQASAFIKNILLLGGSGGTFNFISDSSDSISSVNSLVKAANQDAIDASTSMAFDNFRAIEGSGKGNNILFSNAEKYYILNQALQSQNQKQGGTNTASTPSTAVFQQSVVQNLINRIQAKSGHYITSKDYLTSGGPNSAIEKDTTKTIDVFKVTNELTSYMQEWQKAVKLFYHSIKNAAEFRSLDDDATTSNALLNPGTFRKGYIPEVYEHMIEDESYDDYGPGSGNRYVIRRSQIRNIRIGERAPNYTTVEVHGTFPGFSETEGGGGAQGVLTFPGGGNSQVSAIAIDYDMWRNYGFKQGYVINVPFLTDPESQLGPYASIILSRDRHNVLSGTLTISGNEYMQPGEVIFLEDRNMLFYVSSVTHSLDLGSSFTTTLELNYGHGIGEYIPTVMDTIGKMIYKNREVADMIIQRQESSANEENLGVIQLSPSNTSAPPIKTGQEGDSINPFNDANTKVFNNILYNTQYVINMNQTAGNNIKAKIELRIYYDGTNPVNSQLKSIANGIKNQLTDPSGGGPTAISYQNQPVQNNGLPANAVEVVTVNMDNQKSRKSPSQKAIDAARVQMANTSTNKGSASPSNPTGNDNGTDASAMSANNNALRKVLFSYIIDCWVSFEQVSTAAANSKK